MLNSRRSTTTTLPDDARERSSTMNRTIDAMPTTAETVTMEIDVKGHSHEPIVKLEMGLSQP